MWGKGAQCTSISCFYDHSTRSSHIKLFLEVTVCWCFWLQQYRIASSYGQEGMDGRPRFHRLP
jgi:hypothetical protein